MFNTHLKQYLNETKFRQIIIMKTLVCTEPKNLEYVTRVKPEPKSNEVVLKVKAVGICGTDIHAWAGVQPFFEYPRVLGHEIFGVIDSVGSNVTNLQKDQRAIVMPYVSCGKCDACLNGKTNCCENISVIGVHQDGGFSEFLTVPADNILPVDDNVSADAAAFIEPFSISAHAVRRANIKPGHNVLVVGSGPIGLGAAAVAKANGGNVVVADISKERQAFIEDKLELKTVNPMDDNFEESLRNAFGGRLPLKVLDATGNMHSMNNAVNLISHGGDIVFIGLHKGDVTFKDTEFHKKETTMMGSRNATKEDFQHVINLMSQGILSYKLMLTHKFKFDTLANVYEEEVVNNKNLFKGIIEFS